MIDFPQVEVELWLKLCSYFFERTNTLFVLDGCAASKDVKNRTGKLVSLGFSAHHAGISVWVPTSRSPALQNPSTKMWLRLLFYNPSAKTKKSFFEVYAGALCSEEYKELIVELEKTKIFLSGIALCYPYGISFFY